MRIQWLTKAQSLAKTAPCREPEIGMEAILPAHMAARCTGLYSMRKAGYVLQEKLCVWLAEHLRPVQKRE
jgi:hypothetical protein